MRISVGVPHYDRYIGSPDRAHRSKSICIASDHVDSANVHRCMCVCALYRYAWIPPPPSLNHVAPHANALKRRNVCEGRRHACFAHSISLLSFPLFFPFLRLRLLLSTSFSLGLSALSCNQLAFSCDVVFIHKRLPLPRFLTPPPPPVNWCCELGYLNFHAPYLASSSQLLFRSFFELGVQYLNWLSFSKC